MTTAPVFARSSAAPPDVHFDWADPLRLDEALSEEERMVRDSADDYCQEKL
jgi:glutaryl-CoA dehydrogenase